LDSDINKHSLKYKYTTNLEGDLEGVHSPQGRPLVKQNKRYN